MSTPPHPRAVRPGRPSPTTSPVYRRCRRRTWPAVTTRPLTSHRHRPCPPMTSGRTPDETLGPAPSKPADLPSRRVPWPPSRTEIALSGLDSARLRRRATTPLATRTATPFGPAPRSAPTHAVPHREALGGCRIRRSARRCLRGGPPQRRFRPPTATRPADRETPDRIRSPGLPAGRTHRRGPAPSRPQVAMPSTAPLKQPPPAPIHLRHVMTIPKVTGRRANTLRLSGDPTVRRGPPPPVTALRRRSAEPTAPTGSVLPLPRIRPHRRRGSPTRQSPPPGTTPCRPPHDPPTMAARPPIADQSRPPHPNRAAPPPRPAGHARPRPAPDRLRRCDRHRAAPARSGDAGTRRWAGPPAGRRRWSRPSPPAPPRHGLERPIARVFAARRRRAPAME